MRALGINNHFNCTIQELKRKSWCLDVMLTYYFNCTIQELKLAKISVKSIVCRISIAPYRN